MVRVASHIAYLSVAALFAASVPVAALGDARGTLIAIGVIGFWRYGWALVNITRALIFLRVVYPIRRRRAAARYDDSAYDVHGFILTTTYGIAPEVTLPVYQSIFRAAAACAGGSTIVASVVESSDARLVRQIFTAMPIDMGRVKLIVDQIPGTGKRDALARSLELIARQCPNARDVILFVDGDSCVPEDILLRSAQTFTDPGIGALTTDEAAEIPEPGLFRDWFNLRFTQRQVMMCSMGLSERVLTLTGRMSAFRADLATDPEFIRSVRHDHIDHWRLGRVQFLTGDDKSTWFWLMKHGYRMAYLPDVSSSSMESQPRPGFVDSAVTLMIRWFGNMLRTNARALNLPPSRIGFFTWWSILDQRVSIWTTLAGPIGVLLTAILIEPLILPAYIAWVMLTRYVFCTILCAFKGRSFPITFPPLLYFSQVVGAAVKSYVMFRLDRQKWTRQSGTGGQVQALPFSVRLRTGGSVYLHLLAFGWLIVGVAYLTQLV